jgi:signal transduction histidine kinase
VGVISHELKTPVAVIQAYTDVLRRRAEKAGNSADLDVLRRIGDQVERMLHMVDQTLDLQRLEVGLMSLESSRFDLGALASRVVDEMSALTAQHRLTVQIDSTLPVMVLADRRRVEEVLTNLLQNAIKFSTSGVIATRIWQNDSVTEPMAYVSVSDQGPGIAIDQQERVFERFYQGVERLYRGHVGLGLGLHISREIVRRHGGDIRLTSQPEQGATFTFWLPVGGPDSGEP